MLAVVRGPNTYRIDIIISILNIASGNEVKQAKNFEIRQIFVNRPFLRDFGIGT